MWTYYNFNPDEEKRYLPELTRNEKNFMKELVESLTINILEEREDIAADIQDIELIPGVELSGYIPFTDGGYCACIPALLQYAKGSGHIPKIIEPFLEQAEEDIEREFCERKNIKEIEWDKLTDKDGDLYNEIEYQYFETGSAYFYKVQCYKTYENAINLRVYINTDFDYGRDYISWMPEKEINSKAYYRTFKVSDKWTKENVEKICEQVGYEVIKFVNNL